MNHPSPALPYSTVLTPQCDRAAAVSPYLLRTLQGCRRTGSGILGPAPGTSPAAHGSVRKPHLLSSLYVKLMILPRQARDKHRKSTQKEMCCLTGHSNASRQAFSFCDAILYLKTIIYPRQARDEHRESTQKESGGGVFLQAASELDGDCWAWHRAHGQHSTGQSVSSPEGTYTLLLFIARYDAWVAIQQKSSVCIGETFLSKENINWKKRTRLAVLFSFSGADRADERVGCQGDGGGWRGACATFVL